MKQIDIYQADAFTNRLFGGNPAAICPLKEWLPDNILHSVTIENNLSETAFFVPEKDGFELRWFTTVGEIDLCGHATLATAHIIFNRLNYPKDEIHFSTRFVGPVSVTRKDSWLTLNFPSWISTPADVPPDGVAGLGGKIPKECYVKRDYMFVYENEDDVKNAEPDFGRLLKVGKRICITAPGKDCDFVSRFFCPEDTSAQEDPVTGSAHSMLIPYWAKRLGKTKMLARQLSKRGGELRCEFLGERVLISGQAVTYLQGKIFIPD